MEIIIKDLKIDLGNIDMFDEGETVETIIKWQLKRSIKEWFDVVVKECLDMDKEKIKDYLLSKKVKRIFLGNKAK